MMGCGSSTKLGEPGIECETTKYRGSKNHHPHRSGDDHHGLIDLTRLDAVYDREEPLIMDGLVIDS